MQRHHPALARAGALVAGLMAVLVIAAPAAAAISFDPATGTGSVDKSDVQAAFGWKDQVFQANARKLSFHAERLVAWSWDCGISAVTADESTAWSLGSRAEGTVVGKRLVAVTGFTLTGPGSGTASAPSPASCSSGEPSNVTFATTIVLYVDYRGQSEAISTY